ncbi:MAG: sigma-70 family RNA polymerase sigma factor [Candidatus Desulforudis sp.]|nr:sigma-70 family RNA polymerase sigma factor [Desulforudis sp.]
MHERLEGEPENKTPVLLERAQKGDPEARETLIETHRAFIAKCVLQNVPPRADITATDEYSVALLGFNEAVDRYDPGRGASFHSFARQVIRRRLVDHYRASQRYASEVPHDVLPEVAAADGPGFPVEEVREEIERLTVGLAGFGISFDDLVRETPKHRDSRRIAVDIARRILADPGMRANLEKKKKLPFTTLLRQLVFNPKTVQRHRKYIIAMYLVLGGDFPLLRDWVRGVEQGGEPDGK